MIIHSSTIATNVDEQMIQPNAIDLRIASIEELSPTTRPLNLSEGIPKQFVPRNTVPLVNHQWRLYGGRTFDVLSSSSVVVPEGMCGWLVLRSTFARNGCILQSGLYDAGYDGPIGGILTVPHYLETLTLTPGTRFAQFILAKAETEKLYDGFYGQQISAQPGAAQAS